MTQLVLQTRRYTAYVDARQLWQLAGLALDVLSVQLAQLAHERLQRALGLSYPDSMGWRSHLNQLISDRDTRQLGGHDVRMDGLALTVLCERHPAARVLCWLWVHASAHGWIAGVDRPAMADQIQAALTAGVARPAAADGWEQLRDFLRHDTDDVVTSSADGNVWPDPDAALQAGTWRPKLSEYGGDPADQLNEQWNDLGIDEQWAVCARALRQSPIPRWHPTYLPNAFGSHTFTASGIAPLTLAGTPA